MVSEQVKLKKVLKERNISAYKLAKETNISQPLMYQMINGKMEAFPKWKERISDFLNISEEELFID